MEDPELKDRPVIGCKITPPLLLLITIVTVLFGLWPLNFYSENQVHWLQSENGVQFCRQGASSKKSNPGVIYTLSAMAVPSAGHTFEPTTIEICVESRDEAYPGLAYILSFYDGTALEPLVIGQWKSYLEIRCRNNRGDSKDEYRAIDHKGALLKNVRNLITIASGTDRTDIFVNGELARSFSTASLIGLEHFFGRLVLGNSPSGQNPWAGDLLGLALYNKCLSPEQIQQNYQYWTHGDKKQAKPQHAPIVLYTFDERKGTCVHNRAAANNHLTIPPTYTHLKPGLLKPCWRDTELDRGLLIDVIINVFGFIPFGYCMVSYLLRTRALPSMLAVLVAVLLGAVLSLCIESTQVFLPMRYSSLLDLACNTVGASLGVALFKITCMRQKGSCSKTDGDDVTGSGRQ